MSKHSQIAALQSRAKTVRLQIASYLVKIQEIRKIYDELSKLKDDLKKKRNH